MSKSSSSEARLAASLAALQHRVRALEDTVVNLMQLVQEMSRRADSLDTRTVGLIRLGGK